MTDVSSALRRIPSISQLMETAQAKALASAHSPSLAVAALRFATDALRAELLSGRQAASDVPALLARAAAWLTSQQSVQLRPLINGTGILLHTNLGRARLAQCAGEAAMAAAVSACNLEYDLQSGKRGDRNVHAEALLCQLLGAQGALVVNNNAAAVLLMLSALCQGREVPVSRGELVEIGGSFRVPEIMAQSGCRLVEVGATNKTRLKDYQQALGEHSAALLKVHCSNYKIVGFTEEVSLAELSALAKGAKLPLLYDLGSGSLLPLSPFGIKDEPGPREALAAGADLVCFSGDKLLGGPQAGILVGRADLIQAIKLHPLMRALRPDKMTLAALEATLLLYRDGELARQQIPLYQMLGTSLEELRARAEQLQQAISGIPGLKSEIVETKAQVGGGSTPGQELPSIALALCYEAMTLVEMFEGLRLGQPPLISRIQQDRLLLDMRSLLAEDLPHVSTALQRAFGQEGGLHG